MIDSYYRGYDVILVKDATATTSPEGGFENVCHNLGNVSKPPLVYLKRVLKRFILEQSYGFVTDSERIIKGASK